MNSPELRVPSPKLDQNLLLAQTMVAYNALYRSSGAAQEQSRTFYEQPAERVSEIKPDGMNPCGKKWYLSQKEAKHEMRTIEAEFMTHRCGNIYFWVKPGWSCVSVVESAPQRTDVEILKDMGVKA